MNQHTILGKTWIPFMNGSVNPDKKTHTGVCLTYYREGKITNIYIYLPLEHLEEVPKLNYVSFF